MENHKKRKRGDISCLLQDPEENIMTQPKTTRRQTDIDAQIIFLQEGKHVQLQKPLKKNSKNRSSILQAPAPYPIIIRRVHRSIEE